MKNLYQKFLYLMDADDKKNFLKYLLLLLFGGIVSMIGVGSIIPLIYLLIEPKKLNSLPILNQFSYIQALGVSTGVLISAFWVKNITAFGVIKKQQMFLSTFASKVRNKLFFAYINSPYDLHVKRNSAELINNVSREAAELTVQLSSIGNALNEMITSSLVLILLLWMNVLFTVLVVGTILITVRIVMIKMKPKAKKYSHKRWLNNLNLIKIINHGLGGIKETKIYQKENYFCEKAYAFSKELAHAQVFYSLFGQVSRFIIEAVGITVLLTLIYAFILFGYSGQQVMLLISVFGAAAVQFLPSMNRLTLAFSQISYNMISLNIFYEELRKHEEYRKKTNISNDKEKLYYAREIKLDAISYFYGNKKVLSNISLIIPKGKKVAFVGSTGAGKTTLVDIILGIIFPKIGKIEVDGIEVKESNLRQWRSNFGYIPQMIYIYDCTVRENIAFGLNKNEVNDTDVWAALKQASLDNFIREECADGLDTIVGENGIRLSGGQRQRLGIARALYRNPNILVMDEATAALDNQTEREITAALENAEKNRTVIAIAHRLSTIKNYDMIYMMEKGKIVASGNYKELQERSSRFKQMAGVADGIE